MQEFTDKIIESLEAGVKPWVKPWDESKCAGPQAPFNPTTGARYHGINILILACSMLAFTTQDPRWMPCVRRIYLSSATKLLQFKEKGPTTFG